MACEANILNAKKYFFPISARSRVRGTLEVYHAFIRDLDASDTSSSANLEQDWEIVTDGESEHDGEPEANAQVNYCSQLKIDKSIIKMMALSIYLECLWNGFRC